MKLEIESKSKKATSSYKAQRVDDNKKRGEIEYKNASYLARLMSGLVDVVLVSLIVYFVFNPIVVLDPVNVDDLFLILKYIVLVSLILLFIPEFLFGITPGAALFRIYLVQEKTHSNPPFYIFAIRFFLLRPLIWLSVFPLLIGLAKGRLLYDSLLGTKVIKL